MAVTVKTERELALMREAGRIVAGVHALAQKVARPGITTAEMDRLAEEYIRDHEGIPSFKGYRGFPASTCISINEEVVHGIPGPRTLSEGDVISVDVGVIYQGFHGDASVTFALEPVSKEAVWLMRLGQETLAYAIEQVRPGNRLSDISWAIQSYAEERGASVVRQYISHGIGRQMHEDPQLPNFGPPGRGLRLRPGMTFAIEPMLCAGDYRVDDSQRGDGWTVVTVDKRLSVHYEHTVAVTQDQPKILTCL
ncbi:MAG: type I methionyl aminopeptidase [Chloroflexia bacterium]|nr:type I methionyl aminopeptidase [Chloroflexia bacterium]